MLSGKALRLLLDKFMKSEVAKSSRVQVVLPNGKFYDIESVQLLENKILGARESHRIALTISRANGASLGKVMKKIS
mgnify:CR=1 FL=1|jgi:hypothetical protein|tara:strand:+ start:3314 stop:3544 length:231 start_codon:yes stop_codon:yes gene_type:complete